MMPWTKVKCFFYTLTCLCLATASLRADETNSSQQHATMIGEAVLKLLETRDPKSFAEALAVTHPVNRMQVVQSARLVLDQAARLGIDPSRVHFHVKEVQAKATGTGANPDNRTNGVMLPTSFGIKVILMGEPVQESQTGKPLRGEYELALGGSFEFPAGWRTYEGIRWSHFPDGLADERTKRELMLVSKMATLNAFNAADDPALSALGNTLIRFIQQRDEKIFTNEALRSFEECWKAMSEKMASMKEINSEGMPELPSKKEGEDAFNMIRGPMIETARGLLTQADVLGIDFTGAEITLKDAIAEHAYMRGGFGDVEGVTAGPLRFILSVKSDQKSKSGHPIAGDYILATPRGERGATRWTVEDKIRWQKFPAGLLGEKEKADLAFENYVGEHGALPPGTAAPDIEMIGLNDEAKFKLSDLKGKVLILEWWATWCGPCQEPTAELQTLQEEHPEWKDRVKIIALSIDDELNLARTHMAKHGWTNTFNAWAGSGGWVSAPAKLFRLHGVPTCYLIDAKGNIVYGG